VRSILPLPMLFSSSSFDLAIGHSTNLIGRDSNIIVIRGGNESYLSIHQQMTRAMRDFFPENDVPNGDGAFDAAPDSQEHSYPLQRIDTGITSIVGSNNGERPGGFVLVIEGTALGYVSSCMLSRRSTAFYLAFNDV
jgi:phospholipid-translocating ATPase